MANLYDQKMASIYDAMYQTFIDYDEEFTFYNTLIQEFKGETTLEIGSGTGNLAKRFCAHNQAYLGLDFSQDMIEIAQKRNPNCIFNQGDMRDFKLANPVETILITGRTTSYLISNEDVNKTFTSIYTNLSKDGIVIFDFIDANRFIPFTKKNPLITHQAEHEGEHYIRESSWATTSLENFMLEWSAQYYTLQNGKKVKIADDFSTVRVFTLNEIQLFLYLNNLKIIKTIDRKTYAYDTFVIVAKKNSKKNPEH